MRVAIFGNSFQHEKRLQLQILFQLLAQFDARLYVCEEFLTFLHDDLSICPCVEGVITSDDFAADVAFSVGGDGTFLRTAQRVGNKRIPILGINTGHLGFLADTSFLDIEDTLTELFKNYYRVEERSLLCVLAGDALREDERFALNEVTVSKRDTTSMIKIEAFINDEYLTTYRADGLIVATPTGSTAYSLSVNGPLLLPSSPSILLTPVAPHSLNVRPLVIPDNSRIELRVEGRDSRFLLSLDGRSHVLDNGTPITITKSTHTIKVVKRHNHNFFDTLRNKLNWGGTMGTYEM